MFVTRDKIRLSDLHYELDELIRNTIFMASESLDGEEETVITDFDKFYERLMELNGVDIYSWLFSIYPRYVDEFRGAKKFIVVRENGITTIRDRELSDGLDDYNEQVNRAIEHTSCTYKTLEDKAKLYTKHIQEGIKLLYGEDAITKLLYGECIFENNQDNSTKDNSTEENNDITEDSSEGDNYKEEIPTEDVKSGKPCQNSSEPKIIKHSFMIERSYVWGSLQSGYDVFDLQVTKDPETGKLVHTRTIDLNKLSVSELKSLLDPDNNNSDTNDTFIAVSYKIDLGECDDR